MAEGKRQQKKWGENGKTYGKEKAGFIPVGGASDSGGRTIVGRVPWAGVLPTFQGGQYLKVLRPTMFSTGTRAGAPAHAGVRTRTVSVRKPRGRKSGHRSKVGGKRPQQGD